MAGSEHALAAEDAKHIGLGDAAGDVVGAAVIIFRDRNRRAWIGAIDLLPQARNELDGFEPFADPARLYEPSIPQRAGCIHPCNPNGFIGFRAGDALVADLVGGIPVNVEHIEQTVPGALVLALHEAEKIVEEIRLFVVRVLEGAHSGPAVAGRTEHQGVRRHALDRLGVGGRPLEIGLGGHGCRLFFGGPHQPGMGDVPDVRLVVQREHDPSGIARKGSGQLGLQKGDEFVLMDRAVVQVGHTRKWRSPHRMIGD